MKQIIEARSPDPTDSFAHLRPIVEALLARGNESVRQPYFFLDVDGWTCVLRKPIDFDFLEENFEFPDSIQPSREYQSILDEKTWVEIRSVGPGERWD